MYAASYVNGSISSEHRHLELILRMRQYVMSHLDEIFKAIMSLSKSKKMTFEFQGEQYNYAGILKHQKKRDFIAAFVHQHVRFFFEEHKPWLLPELATFYDMLVFNPKGIVVEGKFYRTVEHYYQIKKFEYLKGLSTKVLANIQELLRCIQYPGLLFDMVRLPLNASMIQKLLFWGQRSLQPYFTLPKAKTVCDYEQALNALSQCLKKQVVNKAICCSWHRDKLELMKLALQAKYQEPALKKMFCAYEKSYFFLEGNDKDRFWGTGQGYMNQGKGGYNYLGRLTTDLLNDG